MGWRSSLGVYLICVLSRPGFWGRLQRGPSYAFVEIFPTETDAFLWRVVDHVGRVDPPPPGVTRCPTNIGARSFPAGTYSPSTNRYYLPIMDSCMGKMGDPPARFLALDLNTLKFAWDVRTRVPQSSGALSTAGGLVFSATPDRYFRAFDDRDGKVLWESPRLNDIPNAFPITYMVDGKQYIAMPVGNPGLQGNSALYAAPENVAVRGSKSSMLWVWELP
jgi:alcohol dehydrogenase (cytochrome c)